MPLPEISSTESHFMKIEISHRILSHLSPEAVFRLEEFERSIDIIRYGTEDMFARSAGSQPLDDIWIPILELRIFRARVVQIWSAISRDPRMPNLVGVSINEMMHVASQKGQTPREVVFEVIRRFAAPDYSAEWLTTGSARFLAVA
jgi:hypothetical protein